MLLSFLIWLSPIIVNESSDGSYPPNASLASFPQDFVITLLTVLVLIESTYIISFI